MNKELRLVILLSIVVAISMYRYPNGLWIDIILL